jgi:hypothetical protein
MSSDASGLVGNTIGVSSDCLYNLKPTAGSSRAYRASVPSSNASTFTGGQVGIFYIPSGRKNTFLQQDSSYLKFTVQNNETDPLKYFNIDNMAGSFINRIDIYHSSNLIETIQGANLLYSYLFDCQILPSAKHGLSTIYGSNKLLITPGTIADSITPMETRAGLSVFGNATVGNGQKLTFCIPLLSGLLGMGSESSLPIGELLDDIRVEITWEQNNVAVAYSAATSTTWSIIQAELQLTILEMGHESMEIVKSVTPFDKPVYMHMQSYRHYVSSLPAASSGGFSMLIPARFASMTRLIVLPRPNTTINNQLAYSISSRANPNISNYYFRIGSYLVPNKMITLQSSASSGSGYAEGFAELLKSFHALSAPQYASGISADGYNVADTADNTVGGGSSATVGLVTAFQNGTFSFQNAFAIAQELESYSNRSSVMLSGINCLGQQTFFEGAMNSSTTSLTTAYTFDFFANYDCIVELSDGILSAKF